MTHAHEVRRILQESEIGRRAEAMRAVEEGQHAASERLVDAWADEGRADRAREAADLAQAREVRARALRIRSRIVSQRALALLLGSLTPEQADSYRARAWFLMRTRGGTTYRIRRGLAGNIERLGDDGLVVERLCIHAYGIPVEDNVLAQKLSLEADEPGVRARANFTPVSPREALTIREQDEQYERERASQPAA